MYKIHEGGMIEYFGGITADYIQHLELEAEDNPKQIVVTEDGNEMPVIEYLDMLQKEQSGELPKRLEPQLYAW